MSTRRITDIADVAGAVDRTRWTGVIPAAGRGSRMGGTGPKALRQVAGRALVDWVLDALGEVCSRFVIVVSNDGYQGMCDHLARRGVDAVSLIVQSSPTGMGDAVLLCETTITTSFVAVAWADQVLLSRRTVHACAALHEARADAILTLPTVVRPRPYTLIERDEDDKLLRVGQVRERTTSLAMGENDCGLFFFSSDGLFECLHRARRSGLGIGEATGEFNLVQILPLFDSGGTSIHTVRIHDAYESYGINTLEDAELAESALRRRVHPPPQLAPG